MITLPTNVAVEANKDENWPIRLFTIGGTSTLRFTDAQEDVAYAGQIYLARGISYSNADVALGFEVDSYSLTIENHDDTITGWALTADQRGYKASVRKGFCVGTRNGSNQLTLVDDYALLLFEGKTTHIAIDTEATISVKSALDLHEQNLRSKQQVTCRFRFKDRNCGYTGAATDCNFTGARCAQLNNVARFGGFPKLNSRYDG